MLERDAAAEAVTEERTESAAPEAAEPKAYIFDGWGMTPLEL